ncbi:uncharacterized protein BcabD6B2_20670 [Babesia caballi]|uniref:Btz domain-containing protein n=1 Tax=Babesia caballi TaxID=5871 RepID=A0AAV4LQW4_BABCB|nr:hypothetical protein, conserved [Babesia caballi]
MLTRHRLVSQGFGQNLFRDTPQKGSSQKGVTRRPSRKEMRRRDGGQTHQELTPNEASAESPAAAIKNEAPAWGRTEKKFDVKSSHRKEVRQDAKGDSKHDQPTDPVLVAAAEVSSGSQQFGGRVMFGANIRSPGVNSYASVAKGAGSPNETQQLPNHAKNEPARRSQEGEAEEDIVKSMLMLYRTRFGEFRKSNEHLHRNSHNRHSPQRHRDAAAVNRSIQSGSFTAVSSHSSEFAGGGSGESELQRVSSVELSARHSGEGASHGPGPSAVARVEENGEAAADEQGSYSSRQRRHDAGRNHYVDRRRRNYNERFVAEGEDRSFGNYGKFRNRFNGQHNHKRNFKKEERPQEA